MSARGGSLLNRDTIVERGEGGIKGNLSRQVDRKKGFIQEAARRSMRIAFTQ